MKTALLLCLLMLACGGSKLSGSWSGPITGTATCNDGRMITEPGSYSITTSVSGSTVTFSDSDCQGATAGPILTDIPCTSPAAGVSLPDTGDACDSAAIIPTTCSGGSDANGAPCMTRVTGGVFVSDGNGLLFHENFQRNCADGSSCTGSLSGLLTSH